MTDGAGKIHITIDDGTLRFIMRNELVAYADSKWGPPYNWIIDTVGWVSVHGHWLLRPGGNQIPPMSALMASTDS